MKKLLALPALFVAQHAMAQVSTEPPSAKRVVISNTEAPSSEVPTELRRELASGDGKTKATAFVIYEKTETTGVDKEYSLVRHLGYVPQSQSLVTAEKAYDVMTVLDPKTGQTLDVWFDISGFFGKF